MRFVVGAMPATAGFDPDGWVKLDEPEESRYQLLVLVLSATLIAAAAIAWSTTHAVTWPAGWLVLGGWCLAVALLLVPLHEVLHAVAYPGADRGEVVFGYWPRMYAFYAGFTGQIAKKRLLWVYLLPFILLSVLPFVLAFAGERIAAPVALLSIINAGFSSSDLLVSRMILRQVPRGATCQNDGWDTYWRATR